MKLLVWYNINHNSFQTIYRQSFKSHEVGEINKFNHLLVLCLEFDPPKPRLNEITADKLEKLANRIRYGKRKKIHDYERSPYPWWKR